MPPHGPALSSLENLCCPEADEPTSHVQPTLNHVQSVTMTSAVLAVRTRALHGTNWGSGPAIEESENDVGSIEQLLLYADEHYLAGKLPLGDHLGKVLHGVEEYHQRNVSPLRFRASQLKWTGYHRLWPPRQLHQLCGQCDVEQCRGKLYRTRAPPHPYTVIICLQHKPGFITKHNLLPICDIPH
ncbi:uncharacterized protein TNCV_1038371 [Trichonephila clavipes]|uniref:Uncharacterized protein n=1 Tax=Trichonephila clavipes TaxID=2585209 RepID=A0A8X7B8Y4_TRICX|nr:uncharacterized protein TNCV_1038371 [Trichonephila clavipes]